MAAGSIAGWCGCKQCDGSWSSSPCLLRGRCRTRHSCTSLVNHSFCWVVLLHGLSSPEADCLFLSGPSQLGTFKSDDGDYFVEPLLSLEEQEYEEEHNKPHLVYRHRTPPTNSSGDRQTCDTPGTHFVTALDGLVLPKGNYFVVISRFVRGRRDVELRDPSRNGTACASPRLAVVLLSWRDVVRLCFLVIGYKEVAVRKNVMVSISSML